MSELRLIPSHESIDEATAIRPSFQARASECLSAQTDRDSYGPS
jgi:hypothetical protein